MRSEHRLLRCFARLGNIASLRRDVKVSSAEVMLGALGRAFSAFASTHFQLGGV